MSTHDHRQELALDAANTLLDAVMAGEFFNDAPHEENTSAGRLALDRLFHSGAVTVQLDPAAERALIEQGLPASLEVDLTPVARGAVVTIELLARTLAVLAEAEMVDVIATIRHKLRTRHLST